MDQKLLVAMSGGVDSSVAAYLLKQQGFSCTGVMMKLYSNNTDSREEKTCCSLKDAEDARAVAYQLGFPFYIVNFEDAFRRQIIDRFIQSYQRGETPNPCIDCNRWMKFDRLLHRARELELDGIATGHYARIRFDEASGRYQLLRALDASKDQSYVLYHLTQEQLAHTHFPLGEFTKNQIREIAASQGFSNASKQDSQDICFVPDGDYAAFIERMIGLRYPEGDFLLSDGTRIGTHKGLIRYTIGQRKGLGISYSEPLYVCRKCRESNTVILGTQAELFSQELTACDINLISCDRIEAPMRVQARVRYHQPAQWATLTQPDSQHLHLLFDEPQRAIAPGQSVVCYQDELVVGGGTIESPV